MHKTIQAHFQTLENAVKTTDIPADRQDVIATSIGRLAALYTEYRETNESRYGDQITRVVQSLLKELEACPKSQKRDADSRAGRRLLHEELATPPLPLKALAPPPKPPKPRKK